MSIDKNIIDIVCCPVTRLPMELMPKQKLHELNKFIKDSELVNRFFLKVGETDYNQHQISFPVVYLKNVFQQLYSRRDVINDVIFSNFN